MLLCSLNWQHQLCKNPRPNPDIKTLFIDHTCGPPNGARAPPPTNPLVGGLPKQGTFPPLGAHSVSVCNHLWLLFYLISRVGTLLTSRFLSHLFSHSANRWLSVGPAIPTNTAFCKCLSGMDGKPQSTSTACSSCQRTSCSDCSSQSRFIFLCLFWIYQVISAISNDLRYYLVC